MNYTSHEQLLARGNESRMRVDEYDHGRGAGCCYAELSPFVEAF